MLASDIAIIQDRKWHVYYISSHCNSLGRLSLEIEFGSSCFHLEKQTNHSVFCEDFYKCNYYVNNSEMCSHLKNKMPQFKNHRAK